MKDTKIQQKVVLFSPFKARWEAGKKHIVRGIFECCQAGFVRAEFSRSALRVTQFLRHRHRHTRIHTHTLQAAIHNFNNCVTYKADFDAKWS